MLINDLLLHRLKLSHWFLGEPIAEPEKILEQLRNAKIFEITPVADYFYNTNSQEYWTDSDFPNLAPPFPLMWFEWVFPKTSNNEGKMEATGAAPGSRIGALIKSVTSDKGGWSVGVVDISYLPSVHRDALTGLVYMLEVDDKGKYVEGTARIFSQDMDNVRANAAARERMHVVSTFRYSAFMAISFLHCKNVKTLDVTVPIKVRKAREKNYGTCGVDRYHTIEIRPMREVLRKEGTVEESGVKKALHICRGHFSHYPEEGKGLFGKGIFGDFWVPAHTRGSLEKGKVISAYKVGTPGRGQWVFE